MKNQEVIYYELKKNHWPKYTENAFVKEILFRTAEEQFSDEEEIVSQVWGVRLNEQGELTSEYELLTLTDHRLLSVYSDIDNEDDKIKVFSQDIKGIHKFSVLPSAIHNENIRINVILKGTAWSIETNDFETAEHFNKKLDELLINAKHEKEVTAYNNLTHADEKTSRNLKTIHAEFLNNKAKVHKQHFKKNLEVIKKYAKNNILWYSIALVSAFSILIISSVYLGIFNEGGFLTTVNRNMLIAGGVFTIIFGMLSFLSYLMLTIKVWDKEKFSRNLYRVLLQLTSTLLILVLGILMTAKLNSTGNTSALLVLPISFLLLFDAIYNITKTYNELKQVK